MRPFPQNQPRQKKQKQQRRAPAAVPPSLPVQLAPTDTPGVLESEIGQGTAPASPSRRHAVTPLLRLTPTTLRQQFILTELLQPPLALRENR
jgi:hypothetical protein